MGFKARKVSKGMFEVHGLETFIEKRVAALWKVLQGAKKAAPVKAAKAKRVVRKVAAKVAPKSSLTPSFQHLASKLQSHAKRAELVRAGKQQKDQLLRSLIPLYLAQKLNVEVTSGATSLFWKQNGVKYLAPNAAKALREHVGYARLTKTGRQITPNGIKYVEAALTQGRSTRRAA